MPADYTLGIDFGTTNSVCAVLSGGDPEVLENAEGSRTTPSVAYYTKGTEQNRPLIGESAVNKANEHPERVVASVKREMGESEFITVPNTDTDTDAGVGDDEYRVEEVAADIIRKLRTDAAKKLDIDRDRITDAVITTPAYWESDRKQAVIQAGELAGFETIRTIKEPAAAAISYGRFKPGVDKTVAVYDLGGGTFDFAIVDVTVTRDSDGGEYTVVTQSGDPQLGGDDWDQRIVEWISDDFESRTGIDPLEPHYSDDTEYEHKIRHERIRSKAREAKESLSNRAKTSASIRIPFLMDVDGTAYDIDTELTQIEFESFTEDLISQTVDPIRTALADANREVDDIDDVILVGGSTRMPQVTELVKSVFTKEPKNRVNPDEAVASGAAVKANRNDILLLEVTPLSLGIGVRGDRFKRMVNRNERLPTRTTEVFTTASEGSQAVRIPIYQGERDVASENRQLKTLIIQGMAPGKRSSAHVEVTFEVQQNGLINVRAVENTRNKSVGVEIAGENQLSDEYVSERVEKARELEDMDRRRQKVIEGQNDAEKAISDAEKLIDEFSHVFQEEDMTNTRQHISNVRSIRQDDTATLGELRDATENLNKWVLTLGDQIRDSDARPQRAPGAPVVDKDESSEAEQTASTVQTDQPGQAMTNSGGFGDATPISEGGSDAPTGGEATGSDGVASETTATNFEFTDETQTPEQDNNNQNISPDVPNTPDSSDTPDTPHSPDASNSSDTPDMATTPPEPSSSPRDTEKQSPANSDEELAQSSTWDQVASTQEDQSVAAETVANSDESDTSTETDSSIAEREFEAPVSEPADSPTDGSQKNRPGGRPSFDEDTSNSQTEPTQSSSEEAPATDLEQATNPHSEANDPVTSDIPDEIPDQTDDSSSSTVDSSGLEETPEDTHETDGEKSSPGIPNANFDPISTSRGSSVPHSNTPQETSDTSKTDSDPTSVNATDTTPDLGLESPPKSDPEVNSNTETSSSETETETETEAEAEAETETQTQVQAQAQVDTESDSQSPTDDADDDSAQAGLDDIDI